MTDAASTSGDGYAMPAEWVSHARSWLAWPARAATWGGAEGLDAARAAHVDLARAILAFEPVRMACAPGDVAEVSLACGPGIEIVPIQLSEGWMRDVGPTFVRATASGDVAGIDWRFDGWGGRHEDWRLDVEVAASVLQGAGLPRIESEFTLEGGAIHVDGEGTALVTEPVLLDPRRNQGVDRDAVERLLSFELGVRSVIWLAGGLDGDETGGHVDNVACFAAPGIVLFQGTTDVADRDYETAAANLDRLHAAKDAAGRTLEIVELPQPARVDRDGKRLPLSYVSFAFVNGGLIVPAFEDTADDEAFRIFKRVFPDREIIPFPALDLVRGGAGIHSATLAEPI